MQEEFGMSGNFKDRLRLRRDARDSLAMDFLRNSPLSTLPWWCAIPVVIYNLQVYPPSWAMIALGRTSAIVGQLGCRRTRASKVPVRVQIQTEVLFRPWVPVTVLIILAFIGLLLCDFHVSFWLVERESLWRQQSWFGSDSIRPASW